MTASGVVFKGFNITDKKDLVFAINFRVRNHTSDFNGLASEDQRKLPLRPPPGYPIIDPTEYRLPDDIDANIFGRGQDGKLIPFELGLADGAGPIVTVTLHGFENVNDHQREILQLVLEALVNDRTLELVKFELFYGESSNSDKEIAPLFHHFIDNRIGPIKLRVIMAYRIHRARRNVTVPFDYTDEEKARILNDFSLIDARNDVTRLQMLFGSRRLVEDEFVKKGMSFMIEQLQLVNVNHFDFCRLLAENLPIKDYVVDTLSELFEDVGEMYLLPDKMFRAALFVNEFVEHLSAKVLIPPKQDRDFKGRGLDPITNAFLERNTKFTQIRRLLPFAHLAAINVNDDLLQDINSYSASVKKPPEGVSLEVWEWSRSRDKQTREKRLMLTSTEETSDEEED